MIESSRGLTRRGGKAAVVFLALVALWAIQTAITFAHRGGDFRYTDAATHALDGVFFSDVYHDLPLDHLKTYALSWYARWPRLGLGYYPPLFAMVEGAAFGLFGVSISVARGVVFAFALLGVTFLFLGTRRLWSTPAAFVSCVLYIASPGLAKLSREVMLEVPAMSLLCVAFYCLAGYLRRDDRIASGEKPDSMPEQSGNVADTNKARLRQGMLPGWALAFTILAAYAKQPAGLFIAAVIVAIFVKHGRRGWRSAALAGGIFVVAVSPLLVGLVWLGRITWKNIAGGRGLAALASPANWWYYPHAFVTSGSTLPVAVLALLGLAGGLLRGEGKRWLVVVAWAAVFYVVMSLVGHKSPRLGLFWVAPLGILAGGALDIVRGNTRIKALLAAAVVATCAWQCYRGARAHYPHVAGFKPVAQFIADYGHVDSVFYQGHHNGSFIFRLREVCGRKSPMVLRASKVVHTTAVMPAFGGRQHIFSEEELLGLLRRFGAKLIVLESHNPEEDGFAGLKLVRGLVATSGFRRLKTFEIRAEDPKFRNLYVGVYEFLEDVTCTAETIDLDFLPIGRSYPADLDLE